MGVDDAVLAGGGALVGVVSRALVDLAEGNLSGWEDYAGAAIGGALGGEAIEYTGGVGTGAIASGSTEFFTELFKTWSGKQCEIDLMMVLAAGATGAALGRLPEFSWPGISSGRNSWNAIAKATRTKLANGTINNASAMTAAKAVVGSNVAGAYGGVGGLIATEIIDDNRQDSKACK